MKPTTDFIARKFQEFNTQMFGGKLTMPPIQLSRARTFVGQCAAKKRRTLLRGTQLFDFCLKFSICFDLSEAEWEDTIIHEMIHYYIGINGLKVLPRIRQRIEAYRTAMLRDKRFSCIDLYMSNDPYFNRFPNSSAFNVILAKEEEFMPHIEQATTLKVLPYFPMYIC